MAWIGSDLKASLWGDRSMYDHLVIRTCTSITASNATVYMCWHYYTCMYSYHSLHPFCDLYHPMLYHPMLHSLISVFGDWPRYSTISQFIGAWGTTVNMFYTSTNDTGRAQISEKKCCTVMVKMYWILDTVDMGILVMFSQLYQCALIIRRQLA